MIQEGNDHTLSHGIVIKLICHVKSDLEFTPMAWKEIDKSGSENSDNINVHKKQA